MFGRLIQVVLAFFVASILIRLVRSMFARSSPREAPPRRTGLDPAKRVAASWNEVDGEREGDETN